MASASYNLILERGADFDLVMTWADAAGNPVDLTSWTGRMSLKKSYTSKTSSLDLNTTNGRMTLGDDAGTITLALTAAQVNTLPAGQYIYDLELVSDAGKVHKLVRGTVTVREEATT